MRGQRGVSLFEKSHVGGAVHKTHMRAGMDERPRVRDRPLGHEVGPQLPREVELDVDVERLRDVDAAVAPFRRVVELAQCRVPGAGIVPGVGTLLRRAVQRLENFEVERGLELLEEHRQRGAHDPRADQDDIPFRGETISDHAVSPTSANTAARKG